MESFILEHSDKKQFKLIENCVYRFISPSGKSYIGISKKFYRRYLDHKREYVRTKTKFYDSCKKYGFENYKIQILKKDIEDDELLKFLEVLYIEKYKTQDSNFGYNMTEGGDGNQLSGKANGMYGKKHSKESIQKMKDNCFKPIGELNAWHSSNKTAEELAERTQKAVASKEYKKSQMSEEELVQLKESNSNRSKKAWSNPDNNMQNSLNALRYWEYKTEEELSNINKKKSHKGVDDGRAKIFIIESPAGDRYEICLDANLKLFCEENDLIYRAFQTAKNDIAITEPKRGDSKFYSDESYAKKRLNTVGWKISTYRRKDYEINL